MRNLLKKQTGFPRTQKIDFESSKYLWFDNFTRQKATDTSRDSFKARKSEAITPKKQIILREFCWEKSHIK